MIDFEACELHYRSTDLKILRRGRLRVPDFLNSK